MSDDPTALPSTTPHGIRVDHRAEVIELSCSWRAPSTVWNIGLGGVALSMLAKGVLSALGPDPSPIAAGVALIGMWWPVAYLVNRTRVRVDSHEVEFVQRPIPLLGKRTFALKDIASFEARGRDVMIQHPSREAVRGTRAPFPTHATHIARVLNDHLRTHRARAQRAPTR